MRKGGGGPKQVTSYVDLQKSPWSEGHVQSERVSPLVFVPTTSFL